MNCCANLTGKIERNYQPNNHDRMVIKPTTQVLAINAMMKMDPSLAYQTTFRGGGGWTGSGSGSGLPTRSMRFSGRSPSRGTCVPFANSCSSSFGVRQRFSRPGAVREQTNVDPPHWRVGLPSPFRGFPRIIRSGHDRSRCLRGVAGGGVRASLGGSWSVGLGHDATEHPRQESEQEHVAKKLHPDGPPNEFL